MNSIYSVIFEANGTVILQNTQISQNLYGSFLKLTPSSIMLGECTQSFQCTSSNILNILFSNSTGSIFSGSWTAFCPAFSFYLTSPGPISVTTKKTTIKTTPKTTTTSTKINTISTPKVTTPSTTSKITTTTTSIKIAG
jgi:hypothetical protein